MNAPIVSPARFGPRQAQPVDSFLGDAKSVLEGLFAKVDPKDLPPEARMAVETRERIATIAARKFGDAEGEELLEAICDEALRRPFTLPAHSATGKQRLAYADQREGQAQLAYWILALIAAGRSEQQPQRNGANNVSKRKRRTREKPARSK